MVLSVYYIFKVYLSIGTEIEYKGTTQIAFSPNVACIKGFKCL